MALHPPAASTTIRVRGLSATIIGAAAAIVAVRMAAPLLVPILVSVLLAYALEPFVSALIRWRLPRLLAAIFVYVLLAVALVSLARAIHGQVTDFLDELPNTAAEVQRALTPQDSDAPGFLDRLRLAVEEIHDTARLQPAGGVKRVTLFEGLNLRRYFGPASRGLAVTTVNAAAVLLLTFLLLVTGELLKRKLVHLAGSTFHDREMTLQVLHDIDRQIERFLIVRVLISVIVATGTGLALWAIGLEDAIVWGILAGALNTLPFLGPMTAVALITLAAFLQFKTLEMAALACGLSGLIAALEGNLVTPWLTSRAGELNTVAVFIAVLFWGWMWGMWGLLLAVPILMAVKAAADHTVALRPFGELLSK